MVEQLSLYRYLRHMERRVSRLFERLNAIGQSARLPVALGIAITASILLTCVSVWLYDISGDSKLDLSRPGFEQERSQVAQSQAQKTYDTTSPITQSTIDSFLGEFDGYTARLKGFGNFQNQPLSDSVLKFTTN